MILKSKLSIKFKIKFKIKLICNYILIENIKETKEAQLFKLYEKLRTKKNML